MTSIKIYNPVGNPYYSNANKNSIEFPITDLCERSAKVMGEDYVRLQFNLYDKITFDAFSFIEYDNQTFFLREQYIPTPNGTYYTYDVKFVSVANMLDKHVCYRHVKVTGAGEWYEPEININGTLDTMYVIVMGSIKRAAEQYNGIYYGHLLSTIYTNGMASDGINPNYSKVKITANTHLLTFNFSGDNIANVCTTIANNYTKDDKKDTEWYITEEHGASPDLTKLTLHFAKCQSDENQLQEFSDYVSKNNSAYAFAHPYVTGGLRKVEYAQSWSGITNVIIPYGSDRNMAGQSVKGIDEITNLQSTFGKRLRLEVHDKDGNPKTYKVIDKDGNEQEITINEQGGIRNDFVNTGIEQVKFFDEVYPQAHFRVKEVTTKNKRQDGQIVPEYTIHAVALDNKGEEMSTALLPDGIFPLQIEEGTTLSVRFESGLLNGREFEIANKTKSDVVDIDGEEKREYSLIFTIVADGSIEDGTLIPSGNFIPRAGDKFALFNMKMPDVYVELAQQELAQKAYEELVKIQTTRPEVKCSSDPTNFNGQMSLGGVVAIRSELFNSEGNEFKSRIISYSYRLTKPMDVQFSLASAIMQGTLSSMNNLIANVTQTAGGLDQRTINLSRRAWRDATEMAEMLDSLKAEMLLVGEEKFQFAFSSAIQCVHENNAFVGLEVSAGTMQHTQEPYINYSNGGFWGIGYVLLNQDEAGNPLKADTPYYVYAYVEDTEYAEIVLNENAYSNEIGKDEPYLMLGILSSEYEGERIFNRTNGFTQIAGGTITTEQVQDAGRNLIIDFQRAEIIARGGAKIRGNIEFQLTQSQIDYILSQLDVDTSAFEYLREALADGSTLIDGGLLLTHLLMLRDAQRQEDGSINYVVNAGMSGVQEDNILLWGGADYADAENAAKNDYSKINGDEITTLIKKDGTGKIGVAKFGIDDLSVDTEDGKIVIDDNEGLSCHRPNQTEPVIKLTPKELLPIDGMRGLGVKKGETYSNDNIEFTIFHAMGDGRPDNVFSTNETLNFDVYVTGGGTITINGDARAHFVNPDNESYVDITDSYMNCTITNEKGEQIANFALRRNQQVVYAPTTGNYTISFRGFVRLEGKSSVSWEENVVFDYAIGLGEHDTFVYYQTEYTEANKQTTIAYKGFFTYQGEKAYFYYKDGVGLECKVGNSTFNVKGDTIECKVGNTNLVLSGNGIKAIGLPNIEPNEEGMIYKDTQGYLKIK